ncbi:MAG: hypothetical protein KBT15_09285 [Bacteroidales bacterium]|nr:hypothetical protein [Candidatus Minthousia equi]
MDFPLKMVYFCIFKINNPYNSQLAMKEITIDDVKSFLNSMNVKIDIYGMVFAERQRCQETMRMLGINEIVAKSIIKTLDATDFSKYFDDTTQWGCDLWAFGKDINGEEIYIKIGLGLPNRQTVCVSFHRADFPIQYPFK